MCRQQKYCTWQKHNKYYFDNTNFLVTLFDGLVKTIQLSYVLRLHFMKNLFKIMSGKNTFKTNFTCAQLAHPLQLRKACEIIHLLILHKLNQTPLRAFIYQCRLLILRSVV